MEEKIKQIVEKAKELFGETEYNLSTGVCRASIDIGNQQKGLYLAEVMFISKNVNVYIYDSQIVVFDSSSNEVKHCGDYNGWNEFLKLGKINFRTEVIDNDEPFILLEKS